MSAIRRSIKDPNHLALQELGWQFFQDHSKGHSQRLLIIQSDVKAESTQYSLDNSIDPYGQKSINLYILGPIGPIHIPLWEFNHTVQFSRWKELYWPN
ncbi:hypothetical protein O181_107736 [Austropuccinia psidii MF-1]|uniref:Uncharacterized protein n=1 Tax=Austropuccinia psidii MF-1 TaxID=1389203 RepID=A0A9Q3JTG0_9BASI|nr:hypothetical protein [Austropuccinia psidii MF-1]